MRYRERVHIAPGAHLAAWRGSWIGIGSVIKKGVHIGSDVMIGAGSVVLHDIPDRALAYGVRPVSFVNRFQQMTTLSTSRRSRVNQLQGLVATAGICFPSLL